MALGASLVASTLAALQRMCAQPSHRCDSVRLQLSEMMSTAYCWSTRLQSLCPQVPPEPEQPERPPGAHFLEEAGLQRHHHGTSSAHFVTVL